MVGVREERQAQTRARLIDVAAAAFVAEGYAAVSLEEIARRAELTKGAVYSNFESKMDLALAVLERLIDEAQLAIFEQVAAIPDAARRLEVTSAVLSEGFDSGLFRLELEVTAEAMRSPRARAKLSARDDAARSALAAALGRAHPSLRPAELERLATALTAVVNGAALERLKSPGRMPNELIARLVAAMGQAFSAH